MSRQIEILWQLSRNTMTPILTDSLLSVFQQKIGKAKEAEWKLALIYENNVEYFSTEQRHICRNLSNIKILLKLLTALSCSLFWKNDKW